MLCLKFLSLKEKKKYSAARFIISDVVMSRG
jgi:hypothetical protein